MFTFIVIIVYFYCFWYRNLKIIYLAIYGQTKIIMNAFDYFKMAICELIRHEKSNMAAFKSIVRVPFPIWEKMDP